LDRQLFTRKLEAQFDLATVEEIERLAVTSLPPRTRAEMHRHLVRLGLREYHRSGAGKAISLHQAPKNV